MPEPRQARTLSEAYEVLNPLRSLSGEWLKKFYVERPEECSIIGLQDELQLDPSDDDKTLFTGTRGSGKTTELHRLEETLRHDHLTVFMDVEELLNLGDIQYTDLLVLLGLEVFKAARQAGFRADEKMLTQLRFWYEEHILEQEKGALSAEVGAELDVVVARISGQVKTDATRRQRIRAQTQAHLSDLLERLNHLLQELRKKVGRRILVIVDGLDKVYDLNQVRDLFLQGANALLEPACRIIYTVPFALSYTNDFRQVSLTFTRFYELPNVKTREADGRVYVPGVNMLREVLHRRVDPALLTPEAVDRLIEHSGGLIRELIALARSSLIPARRLRGDRGPIRSEDVEHAIRQVQNAYRALLTEEHYRELSRILEGGQFVNSEVDRELIHNLSLLAYDGGGVWWGVHPIVRPLVEEWKRERGV
jgi:energy-coupling factor transporter ATP-binding protein EcfA2